MNNLKHQALQEQLAEVHLRHLHRQIAESSTSTTLIQHRDQEIQHTDLPHHHYQAVGPDEPQQLQHQEVQAQLFTQHRGVQVEHPQVHLRDLCQNIVDNIKVNIRQTIRQCIYTMLGIYLIIGQVLTNNIWNIALQAIKVWNNKRHWTVILGSYIKYFFIFLFLLRLLPAALAQQHPHDLLISHLQLQLVCAHPPSNHSTSWFTWSSGFLGRTFAQPSWHRLWTSMF